MSMTAEAQAALARLNAARPEKVKNYKGEYIPVGSHQLVIAELDRYGQDGTLKVKLSFKVLSSTNPQVQPGSWFVRIFEITKAPFKPGMSTPADEFVECLHKITSTPFNVDMAAQRGDLLYGRFADQLLRGMRVTCHGTRNKKDTYTVTAWDSVAQTQQEISAYRAQLDQTDPLNVQGPTPAQMQTAAPPQAQYPTTPTQAWPSPPQATNFGYPSPQQQMPGAFPPGFPGAQQFVQAFQPQPPQYAQAPAPQMQPPPGWPAGYPYPPPQVAPAVPGGAPLLGGVPGHQKP